LANIQLHADLTMLAVSRRLSPERWQFHSRPSSLQSGSVSELLPASFAALGAVIGFIAGSTIIRIVGGVILGPDADLIFTVTGGLGGAVAFAWFGLRVSGRFANRNAEPS